MVGEHVGLVIVNPLIALEFVGQCLEIRQFTASIPLTASLVTPPLPPGLATDELV